MSHSTYSVFYIYANEDQSLRTELGGQLNLLENKRFIDTWGKDKLRAGVNWREVTEEYLSQSDIVLCLISSDFFGDDYALELLEAAKKMNKVIIPIIMRPCLWEVYGELEELKVLPENKKAITSWNDRESAYLEIVQELLSIVKNLTPKSQEKPSTKNTDMPDINYFDHGYALLIGIRYGHWKRGRLNGTLNDIKNLKNHFIDTKKAAFKEENVIQLTEEKATAEGISKALDELTEKANADSNASVLIYYSGHGETDKTNYFLVPYDFDISRWRDNKTFDSNNVVLSKAFAQKITKIKTKKSMVILDCCHAENIPVEKGLDDVQPDFLKGFTDDLDTVFEKKVASKGLSEELNKGGGNIILTSCRAEEKSLDLGGEGLFTQVLLECFNGQDNIEKDGWVRLIDMIRYIRKTVPKRAMEYIIKGKPHQQHPVFKRINDLDAEEYIVCAYNIAKAKNIDELDEPTPTPKPIPKPTNQNNSPVMTKQEIIKLIDEDIDEAIAIIDDHYQGKFGTINDLMDEYINRPNNFSLNSFRSRLKLYIRRKYPKR